MAGYKITFLPDGKQADVSASVCLNDAAAQVGIDIVTPCGRKQLCHGCRIGVNEGKVAGVKENSGLYLSCSTFPRSDLVVYVPESSRRIDPGYLSRIEIIDLRPDPPSMENLSDDDPLRLTALGMAVDFGQSMVTGKLMALFSGETLGATVRANPFSEVGDNRKEAFKFLNQMVHELTRKAEVDRGDLIDVTLVCNPEIESIISGDKSDRDLSLREIGIESQKDGILRIINGGSDFIGGDVVAGMVASRVCESNEVDLFVEIGPRVSIIAGNSNRLTSLSFDSGGVLNGYGYSHAMRNMPGAIDGVAIKDDVLLNTVFSAKPSGICPAGLISAVAELMRQGLMNDKGRMIDREKLPYFAYEILRRIKEEGDEKRFVLWTDADVEIALTERDAQMLMATASKLKTEIERLIDLGGFHRRDIEKMVFSGGLGNSARAADLARFGIILPDEEDKVRFIGNGALDGAVMAMLSREESGKIGKIRDLLLSGESA